MIRHLSRAALVCVAVSPRVAEASPQGNASLTIGGAGVGTEGRFWDGVEFHLGLHGDVLLAREDDDDFGVGPYAEIGTLAFDELQAGGGISTLLPIHESFPLVLSAGAYARVGDVLTDDGLGTMLGAEPGFAATIFWGSRGYNYSADYSVAWWGVSVGYRHAFGATDESALLIAAQFDLAVIGTPIALLAELASGPTDEAETIEPEIEPESE